MFPAHRRMYLGMVFLAALAIVSAGHRLWRVVADSTSRRDSIAQTEQRYAELARSLPPDAPVGLLTDRPDWMLLAAQYSLAPNLVQIMAAQEYVVLDYAGDCGPVRQRLLSDGYVIRRDLGGGLILLQRAVRP